MSTEKPRFSITVSTEMYNQINEYQHNNKLATQTKAIAQIIQLGLDALSQEQNHKPSVINSKKIEPSPKDEGIVLYEQLDDIDKVKAQSYMEGMLEADKYKQDTAEMA